MAAIVIVTAALLGFFGFIVTRINASPLALLYNELDQQDAATIVQKLDSMKIPYEVDANGSLIRVPSNQVGKLRMMLSGEGLPRGGSVGYEIFDQKEGFGTTSFVQNINHLRALEGELARTISSMDPISSARVHLVLPQRELFSHGTQKATASIFLKTRGSAVLTREQIGSIQHLIAAAVPQLQPNQISIVDEQGNLLARPADESGAGDSTNEDDMRASFEQAQARKIEDLLQQTVGLGKVRAKVSADLDFDRITTSTEVYDPDSQVVRSTQSTNEDSTNSEGNNQSVSVTNNLPLTPGTAPPPAAGAAGPASTNKSNKSEETVNYEINKTVRNQVRESGQVKRLSIAVTVDGIYEAAPADKDGKQDKDAKPTYKPRSDDEMTKLKALAQSAVNFDANRGDTIDVVNLQFAQPEAPKEGASSGEGLIGGLPKADVLHMVETLILAVIGLLVVLLVVRPVLRKILEFAGSVAGGDPGMLAGAYAGAGGGTAQLPPPSAAGGGGFGRDIEAEVAQKESEIERMIDISRVEGRVKASSLRKVGEIVDKHPDEAVGILRNWM